MRVLRRYASELHFADLACTEHTELAVVLAQDPLVRLAYVLAFAVDLHERLADNRSAQTGRLAGDQLGQDVSGERLVLRAAPPTPAVGLQSVLRGAPGALWWLLVRVTRVL